MSAPIGSLYLEWKHLGQMKECGDPAPNNPSRFSTGMGLTLIMAGLYATLVQDIMMMFIVCIMLFCTAGLGWSIIGSLTAAGVYWMASLMLVMIISWFASLGDSTSDFGPGKIYRKIPRGPLVRLQ